MKKNDEKNWGTLNLFLKIRKKWGLKIQQKSHEKNNSDTKIRTKNYATKVFDKNHEKNKKVTKKFNKKNFTNKLEGKKLVMKRKFCDKKVMMKKIECKNQIHKNIMIKNCVKKCEHCSKIIVSISKIMTLASQSVSQSLSEWVRGQRL